MFQTFEDAGDPSHGRERLSRLREWLGGRGLDGFIVPRADEHQGEYIPPSAERLRWLTGFSGSAGTAVVLEEAAAIFVDGRYTLQARTQVDTEAFEPVPSHETPPSAWLADHAAEGTRIGYDPWLMTRAQLKALKDKLDGRAELTPVGENPIDALWEDRPSPPLGLVSLQPAKFAGPSAETKLETLREVLAEKKTDAVVLTDPASIAWTFNIRGHDVAHTPLPLSFAIVPREGRPRLFIHPRKLPRQVRNALAGFLDVEPRSAFATALGDMSGRILLDLGSAPEAVATLLEEAGAEIVEGTDPVLAKKAAKSPAEIAGARAAHVRDGVAMVRFLAWLEREGAGHDEIAAVKALEEFRRETAEMKGAHLEDIAFDTISGAGPNGAIVHYRVSRATSRTLRAGELYLVDSGAQYRDGTTDITRTVLIGEPDAATITQLRDRFTRVLKGHIALARARFPEKTRGVDLDGLARSALWSAGLDYAHGTGHGVGSFLGVHEGPQGISRRSVAEFQPGMIVSNEPGYYEEGAYGIRIENLLLVRKADAPLGGEPMLSFETLTLSPIDRRLVNPRMMSAAEIAWLDTYHARVRASLSGSLVLDDAEREWLARATRPIG